MLFLRDMLREASWAKFTQIQLGQRTSNISMRNFLLRLAILHAEGSTQCFVTRHYPIQDALQNRHI